MQLTVKLFATIKAKAGASQLTIELGQGRSTVKDLLADISAQYPALESSLKSVLVAVNSEYAFPEQVIQPNDEVALFPPVSGG
jgi:molybdopterin converting factor subunit 1